MLINDLSIKLDSSSNTYSPQKKKKCHITIHLSLPYQLEMTFFDKKHHTVNRKRFIILPKYITIW